MANPGASVDEEAHEAAAAPRPRRPRTAVGARLRGPQGRRVLVLATVAAVVLIGAGIAAASVARDAGPSPTAPTEPLPFVSTCGTQFCAGGTPLRVVGANSFPLLFRPECHPQVDQETIVRTAAASHMNVLRFALYQELVLPGFDFSRLDSLVALAHRYHMYLLPYLEDENALVADCFVNRDLLPLSWYASGYLRVDPGHAVSYRDWVTMVLTRYRSESAFFGWTLMSEPVALGDSCNPAFYRFFVYITALAHRIDPDHIANGGSGGPGNLGFDCPSGPNTYQAIFALPGNDFTEFHDYTVPPCAGAVRCLPDAVSDTIARTQVLAKPLLVAELGIDRSDETRAVDIRDKVARELRAGAAGVLVWDLQMTARGVGIDGYAIAPDDPTLAALAGVATGSSASAGGP